MDQDICLEVPSTEQKSYKPFTSDLYRTCNLPKRFNQPSWFYGYGIQRQPQQHPCFRTCSNDYGRYPPSVHTVPASFFPKTQEFSASLARSGNYRNYSLNTALDRSPV